MKNPIENIADQDTYYDNEHVGDCSAAPCSACRGVSWNGGDEVCRACVGSGAIYIQGEVGAWEEPCPECYNPPIGIISLPNASVEARTKPL